MFRHSFTPSPAQAAPLTLQPAQPACTTILGGGNFAWLNNFQPIFPPHCLNKAYYYTPFVESLSLQGVFSYYIIQKGNSYGKKSKDK